MKSLKQQLLEFAARKAVSKAIDMTAYHGERAVRSKMRARKQNGNNATLTDNTNSRKYHTMSFRDQTIERKPAETNRGTQPGYRRDEPVELWVNTVIVKSDGEEPVRILTGRPLRSFGHDRDVTTSNEEFNRVNAVNNSFVKMMLADADDLSLGESRYYGPGADPKGENLSAGIYFQLHREESDPAADAAAKIDIEAEETANLRNLFG